MRHKAQHRHPVTAPSGYGGVAITANVDSHHDCHHPATRRHRERCREANSQGFTPNEFWDSAWAWPYVVRLKDGTWVPVR